MSVPATTAAGSASTTQSNPNSTLNKNDFLKLLVAQLTNQDPSSPLDNTQMVSQLAQFSSLEQTQNMTSAIDQLVASQTDSGLSSRATMIGKEITWQLAADSSSSTAPSPVSGIVGAVTIKNGQISYMTKDGQSVDPSTVTEISDPAGSQAAQQG
ncbi:flagellar hook capping FlgD N-terminal domain-containing protein [Sporolactobacillus putidus]|uniref:Flagellar basal body rod modification protein FlgD n=1 Tax=Sporolactobacillus putidus TaxID=492735 RepID=A0A917RX97_9BACL|nr:flagellar hook capping FlgD N-terminal domain-containing protein [Sporolactobacillus putidus]GGL44079.1 flagellar basal body rod modification protein FlgD [Sporolactobacillus putidus]